MEKEFWENRWVNHETGWDVGEITLPLKTYFDSLSDKNLRILIPGAGNAYEAECLNTLGFTNVFVLDVSEYAIESFKKRCPEFPADHILLQDFFEVNETFDLIVEQTFFCALNPLNREKYCQKMAELLGDNGKLRGLLFDFPLTEDGPPFGGNKEGYEILFKQYFSQLEIVPCYNSIEPRAGKELWLKVN